MKHFWIFFLAVQACVCASFETGQSARLVVGQSTFTASYTGAEDITLGAAGGVAWGNGILYVVDSNRFQADPVNNRVLLFPTTGFPTPTQELKTTTIDRHPTCFVCVGVVSIYLGQPDANNAAINLTQSGFRVPTAVATDGQHVAVADTDNNRILIWNSVPTQIYNQNADVVVGQVDFTHNATAVPPTQTSMRGPQGVWIQNGRLFVADTQDHRVLIYNHIPTSNGAAADVVLGQPNFTTTVPATTITPAVAANTLFSPVSVTSDGTHLFVTDLGNTRVLIWNTIPTTNQQPADVEIGQPDMTTALDNNTPALCASNGTDSSNNPTYPSRCNKTLSFPRFALSDGKQLWIADGGNDRVLGYNQIPTSNGAAADYVLGQVDDLTDTPSIGADGMETPTSLAWDGMNLYVADVFNRRILAFSQGDNQLPLTSMRNAASQEVFALGSVTIGGTITANDTVTITIGSTDSSGTATNTKDYTYTVQKTDSLTDIVNNLVSKINASPGDPYVTARPDIATLEVIVVAKTGGSTGTSVSLSTAVSTNATETSTASGTTLSLNLQSAAVLGPGSLVTVFGSNLADQTVVAQANSNGYLPTSVGGVEVYFDGLQAPIVSVSPQQINAQLPFEMQDRESVSAFVRTTHADGTVTVTNNQAIPVVLANPGIFADSGPDPRAGQVYHASTTPTSAISVDGTINASDVGTVTINGVALTYNVQGSDTLKSVAQGIAALINTRPDTGVTASVGNVFQRILLQAINPKADSNFITVTASVSSGASLILTALTSQLCCGAQNLASVGVGGTITAGDTATITIGSETASYSVQSSDGLGDVAQGIVNAINADANMPVTAAVSSIGTGVVLTTKPNQPSGSISYGVSLNSGATLTLTPSSVALIPNSAVGARVTTDNPALPGEVVYVYATGLGPSVNGIDTGQIPTDNNSQDPPVTPVDSILAGGSTANIIFTGYVPGLVGVYEVEFQLNSSLPTNDLTQLTIAQQSQVSNVVTFPLTQPASTTTAASSSVKRR